MTTPRKPRDLPDTAIGGFSQKEALPREFRALSETRYLLDLPTVRLQFEIDRLHRQHGDLTADLAVRFECAGAATYNGILSSGRLNLDSVTARATRGKQLQQKARLSVDEIDFSALLDELVIRVSAAEREGKPAIVLGEMPMPTAEQTITVAGLTLLPDHPTILFGDGGTLKSMIGLYVAAELTRQGVPTLVVDWELDERDHRRRLGKLYGSFPPRVLYARCDKPLVYEVDRLQRIVQDQGARYMILDSVAPACDARPEDAEVAARYFRAVRQIGVGSLNIAHVNKSEDGDKKPFGSCFWHNLARSTWFIKQGDRLPNLLNVGLYNRKSNLSEILPPIGYTVTFDHQRVTIDQANVGDDAQLAQGLPLWQRVRTLVAAGPLTIAEIAAELDVDKDSVQKAVTRKTSAFTRVPGADGVSRWGLLSRDRSVA